MLLILTVFIVFLVLAGSELWWRIRKPHDEISRKFVHITVGCFAAFWPWYLSRNEIVLIAVAFAAGVLLSKYFNIFKAIHAVQRPTWGELCFAAAVGVLALLVESNLIYAVALLHMALADGLAAIIGTKFGTTSQYRVFGHIKSTVGSVTFFVVSLCLLSGYGALSGLVIPLYLVVTTAATATLMENIAVRGMDNLTVPAFIYLVLVYGV